MACADTWQVQGVNDRVQLAQVRAELNRRVLERWMLAGVTVVDPVTTWVDVGVRLGRDVVLHPGTQLHGATVVDDAGDSIGEIEDFVVSTGAKGTRAVVDLDEHAGRAEGRRVAVPFGSLHVELSGEEALAVPQQARVRVELDGTPLEALPAYEYPALEPI